MAGQRDEEGKLTQNHRNGSKPHWTDPSDTTHNRPTTTEDQSHSRATNHKPRTRVPRADGVQPGDVHQRAVVAAVRVLDHAVTAWNENERTRQRTINERKQRSTRRSTRRNEDRVKQQGIPVTNAPLKGQRTRPGAVQHRQEKEVHQLGFGDRANDQLDRKGSCAKPFEQWTNDEHSPDDEIEGVPLQQALAAQQLALQILQQPRTNKANEQVAKAHRRTLSTQASDSHNLSLSQQKQSNHKHRTW